MLDPRTEEPWVDEPKALDAPFLDERPKEPLFKLPWFPKDGYDPDVKLCVLPRFKVDGVEEVEKVVSFKISATLLMFPVVSSAATTAKIRARHWKLKRRRV